MAASKHHTDEGNPNPMPAPPPLAGNAPLSGEATSPPLPPPSARRLSQVDADLALARALQEQERAYAMLRMNGVDGSDSESSDADSYDDEEDDRTPEGAL